MNGFTKEFEQFLNILDELDEYPNLSKLRYKYMFNQEVIENINNSKLKSSLYTVLPLYSEEKYPLHYIFNETTKRNLIGSVDMINDSKIEELNQVDNQNIINGFIFSEIENSLLIEGVHSSRKKIESVSRKDNSEIHDEKELIIKNMIDGYAFIQENKITVESIYKLYKILSDGCLKDDEKLLSGNKYRHDTVSIINSSGIVVDHGVDFKKLPHLMEELVSYILEEKEQYEHLLAPYIIHYYMIYLHPYFDYNGRMARVLAFWYTLNHIPSISLLFTSEAINNPKNKKYYYKAIEYSRETQNDITYFIEYLSKIAFDTTKSYINFYKIKHTLEGNGIMLTNAELNALKVVLSIEKIGEGYFNWRKYELYDFDDINKQYILRLLNKLHSYKILKRKTQKGAYLYVLDYKKYNLL